MPCDTNLKQGETLAMRGETIKKALTKLEAALTTGKVKLKVGANGALAIDGWKPEDRGGATDTCAIRVLQAQNSWAFKQAVAKAEHAAGRRVNQAAVTAGVHSHDNGKTWNPGHK